MQIQDKLKPTLSKYANLSRPLNENKKFATFLSKDDKKVGFSIEKLENIAKKDKDIFKAFDFMQIINQLMYGNLDENEKLALLDKAKKIEQSTI